MRVYFVFLVLSCALVTTHAQNPCGFSGTVVTIGTHSYQVNPGPATGPNALTQCTGGAPMATPAEIAADGGYAAVDAVVNACNGGPHISAGLGSPCWHGHYIDHTAGIFTAIIDNSGSTEFFGSCAGCSPSPTQVVNPVLDTLGYLCRCPIALAACGDGNVDAGEQCDDGNTISGDGCSATCTIEPGWLCPGNPSVCTTNCGDGIIVGNETCDQPDPGFGCDLSCQTEPGWECPAPNTCDFVCGNGVIDASEECDDGNSFGGDGCGTHCVIEANNNCTGVPSVCTNAAVCGDGILQGNETCDDSNTLSNDGCSSECQLETHVNLPDAFMCAGPLTHCHMGLCYFFSTDFELNDGQYLSGSPPGITNPISHSSRAATYFDGVTYPGFSGQSQVDFLTTRIQTFTHWMANTTNGLLYSAVNRNQLDASTVEWKPSWQPLQEKRRGLYVADQRCCSPPKEPYTKCDQGFCFIYSSTPMNLADAESYCLTLGFQHSVDIYNANMTRGILRTLFPESAGAPLVRLSSTQTFNNTQSQGIFQTTVPSDVLPFMCLIDVSVCGALRPQLCPGNAYDACGKCNGDGSECTCGDGIIGEGFPGYPQEECEDGNTAYGDGCDSTCRVEADYACSGLPSVCCDYSFPSRQVPTPCGCKTPALSGPNKEMPHETCAGETVHNVIQPPMVFFGERDTSSPGFSYFRAFDQCARLNMTLPTHLDYHSFHVPRISNLNFVCNATYDPPTFHQGSPCDGPLRPLGFPDLAMLGPGPVEPVPTKPFPGFRSWWRKRSILPNPPNPTDTCQLYRGDGEGNDGFPPQCQLADPGFPGAEKFFFACIPFPNAVPISCTYDRCGVCNGNNSACCGDGIHQSGEACDDGNNSDGDGCSSTCTLESFSTCTHTYITEPDTCYICGNGVVDPGEACDDGDNDNGDGCSSTCNVEPGYNCVGSPSVCTGICGDGLIRGSESCDDANTVSGDGCSSACVVESGFLCSGEPSICTPSSGVCGDGVLTAPPEECDDGNTIAGDGCGSSCLIEPGYVCPTPGSPCVLNGK